MSSSTCSSKLLVPVLLLLSLFSSETLGLTPTIRQPEDKDRKASAGVSVYKIVTSSEQAPINLPAAHVKTFPRWTLDEQGQLVPIRANPSDEEECDATIDAALGRKQSVQPTLTVVLKPGGVPSYVAVGLVAGDGKSLHDGSNHYLAQQWTLFDTLSAPSSKFRVELFWGADNGSDKRVGIVPADAIQKVMYELIMALATAPSNSALSEGFHMVSVPLPMEEMSTADQTDATWFTCLTLAETDDASQVLAMDKEQVQKMTLSILQVEAVKVLG